jgi:hypothetical protein
MKTVFVCWVISLAALASASASKPKTYQQATVLKVQEMDTQPTYVGSNPSDAPLSSPTYSYKVWLRVDCVTYVARYDSSSDQPDPMFSPNRVIAVNARKHDLRASGPGGRETRMSIVSHSAEPDCVTHPIR